MLLSLLASCIIVCDDCHEPEETCEVIEDDFEDELRAIQSCSEDAECGQPLAGTSCGCTRNLVAREDADTSALYDLMDRAYEQECELGLESTCDCPDAYGFECADGTCAWAYDHGAWMPDCEADRGDAYEVEGLALDGDTLLVTVATGGGCEDHDWQICWPDQVFAESDPVQASLEVWHDSHDDPCDAWITEELSFDLSPLAEAWREAYGGDSGTIVVRVGERSVTWSF